MNGRWDQLPGPVLFDRQDDGASPVYLVIPGPVYVVHGPVTALQQMTGLEVLADRRLKRCLDFSKKCLQHPINRRIFPLNPNLTNQQTIRDREKYKVNFAHKNIYKNSTIPFCQRLLNKSQMEK